MLNLLSTYFRKVFKYTESMQRLNEQLQNDTLIAIGYFEGATEQPSNRSYNDNFGIQLLEHINAPPQSDLFTQSNNKEDETVFLKFTNQEILKMPKPIRTEFRIEGCTARIRKRKCGKNSWTYDLRYRRNGYNICVTAKTKPELKAKFIEKLKTAVPENHPKQSPIPATLQEFTIYYFTTFRKEKVSPATYRADLYRLNNYIFPKFGTMAIKNITPDLCKNLLNDVIREQKGKTAMELYSLLNIIFNGAIAHQIVRYNPMSIVPKVQHEKEHGVAFSKNEEKQLLNAYAGTRFQTLFAVALYTGLRPNEYESARIEGLFIVAKNSKRKNKKVKYKKIPITAMLAPYLHGIENLEFPSNNVMRDRLQRIFPNHKLYDMRTTFYTRCKECDISEAARDEFMGHGLGALGEAYTDLSDEYLLKEGAKFQY